MRSFIKQVPAEGPQIDAEPVPVEPTPEPSVFRRSLHYLQSLAWLIALFCCFYFLSDYTAEGAKRFGFTQMVFSNTMVQLWTAAYRLTFVLIVSKVLQGLFWQFQWRYYRPDRSQCPDLETEFNQLSPQLRVCVYYACFFSLVLAFVLLVSLPQQPAVGP